MATHLAPSAFPGVPPGAAVRPTKSRMHGDDRRKQLLRAAIEMFSRKGFGGTKTKDIAAAAGVSEAILFRHFATKEDLYNAILDERDPQISADADERKIEDLMRKRDDAAVLRLVGAHIIGLFRDDPAFHRLIMFASLEGHVIATLFRERIATRRGEFLKRYILQRQRDGAFRKMDPSVIQLAIISLFVHYAMGRYIFGFKGPGRVGERPDESVIEDIVAIALGGLTTRKKQSKNQFAKDVVYPRIQRKTRKDIHAKA
jgi:AcrR family transcriptional regulator